MEACEWPVRFLGDDCLSSLVEDGQLSPEDRELVEKIAGDLLWSWTGRRFGRCLVEVRPCRVGCGSEYTTYSGPSMGTQLQPALIGGKWFNLSCGTCRSRVCRCTSTPRSIALPGPVTEIEEVWLDGELLEPSDYRIDGQRRLVRIGGDPWPMCQDLDADPESGGAFTVRYLRGYEVPVAGQVAAGKLACQLALAATESDECELPERVQSITRQGVSMAILDSFEDLEDGRTGIWSVDAWVASVNVAEPPAPKIISPDYRR